MNQHRRREARAHHPCLEILEERRVLAQFGVPWHDAQHLTVSFVPDGTQIGTQRSVLFQSLDAQRPTADWQAEILRAFQTWAVDAHLDFGVKPDGGQPLGVSGPDQADPRFGDIRIGAVPMSPDVLSISVPHDPFLSGTWSGDILLNSTVAFDQNVDLFPVLLHEVGHVLGIDHSSDPSSVMFATLNNQRDSLAASDVAAVQSLYGPRPQDPYEGTGGNETLATATAMPTPTGFDGTTPLLLYANISTVSDVDIYSLKAPEGYQGPVTIRLQTAGVSLLAPRLTVYDAAGSVVGALAAAGDTGDTLQFVLQQVDPGATYHVRVEGATTDVFGIGEYALAVNFDARSTITAAELDTVARQTYSYLSPDDINAIFQNPQGALFHDDHHTDDTFGTAAGLLPIGAYGSDAPVRITASLGDPSDIDFYRFETPESPDPGASRLAYQASAVGSPDQPLVMTVTVRATEVNGIMPRVAIYDEDQNPVPALVLAHGDGTDTIQVADARPGAGYSVMVSADPTSGKVVGNYDLDVQFGHVAASPTTFVESSLNRPVSQRSYDLVVNQTQLFDLLLGAPVAATAPNGAVRMDIINSTGLVVATRSAAVGDTAGGDPVLLSPGIYQVHFASASPGNAPPSSMTFHLYGASLSDPIGPALDDPTLKPLADATNSALAASLPPVIGSSGSPYYWLALGLSAPSSAAAFVGSLPQGDRTFVGIPGNASSSIAIGPEAGSEAPIVHDTAASGGATATAASVVVTYTITRASLLTPLVLLGVGTDIDRGGAAVEWPARPHGETESMPRPAATEVATIGVPVVPPQMILPLPLDLAIHSLAQESDPRAVNTLAGSERPIEGSHVNPDAAETVATLLIAAMIYDRTHGRRQGSRGGRPVRSGKGPDFWGSLTSLFRGRHAW